MSQPLINITRKQAVYFAIFLVFYEFLTYIANDMIMPGMLQVVKTFHAKEYFIASSLTAYVLGGASLQFFLGPISDRFGRRPVMLFGAILFFACTSLIACTQTIHQFLIARFFQGMGLCFISVVGYAVLQEIFAEKDAIRMISVMTNVSVLAPLLGPLVGAVCIQYFSWRYIFVFIAICSLIALWGLWRYMPESVGAIKHSGEEIKRTQLSFKTVFGNYYALLCNPSFALGSIAYGLLGIVCVAWIGLSPVILVTESGMSLLSYGFWQIPIFGAFILGNIVLFRALNWFSIRQLAIIGSIIVGIGLVFMLILPKTFSNNYLWLMPGLISYFFAYGLIATPINRLILFATTVSKGTASAFISVFSMSIQALGIEFANYFYSSHNIQEFGESAAIIGVVFSIIFTISFWLQKK